MNDTRRLVITGRVQGVGFRYWMTRTARGLNLSGWVRNRSDGSVEAIVQGAPDAVAAMIRQAHSGPPGAQVVNVEVGAAAGDFSGFSTVDTL
ncbi:MAG TPA: acylphosphatase [Burkholderiales bacterium]|nr:acylphosphatase [Burkholderiales bacterium]